jgi:putative transposase
VVLDFSLPEKPTDNAFIESFNSRFRQECLNEHWFLSLEDATEKIEAWRSHYTMSSGPTAAYGIKPRQCNGYFRRHHDRHISG